MQLPPYTCIVSFNNFLIWKVMKVRPYTAGFSFFIFHGNKIFEIWSIQSLKWLLTSSLLFSGKNRDNLLWNSRFSVSFCFSGSRTCCDIKHSYPGTPSGSYVIDPDGEGGEKPFKDFCDTADENSVGVTVVSHDSENRTLVDGFQDPGSYSCNVTYQGISRTASSVHCEQFLM